MSENSVSRDSQRVPLETRVQLKFEWFGGFISEYSANISPGGMFIRTQTPEPVGRLIGFELRLGDGYELIRGTGEVVWARMIDQGPDKQAGMGIRFLEISPDGRELIYQMVDNYIAQGGTPFDVTDMPGPGPAPAGESAPAEPKAAAVSPASPASLASPASPPPPSETGPTATPPPLAPPPDWLPKLPDPNFGAPAVRSQAPAIPTVPTMQTSQATPAIPELPEEEVSPRRVSRPVRWAILAGGLVLVAALAVFKQEVLLGWFLPGKAPAADVASASGPPLSRKVRGPKASAALPTSPVSPGSMASPVSTASPASTEPRIAVPTASEPKTPPAPEPPEPKPTAAASSSTPPATPPPPQSVEALAPATTPVLPGGAPGEIQKITWKQDPDGTEVILWADGAIRRQDWSHYRIDGDPPRELIKLYGIRHPFPSSRLVAGTKQLLQVRTGYHVEAKGNELHVVLDLSGFGVEVTGIEAQGGQLHVHLKGK